VQTWGDNDIQFGLRLELKRLISEPRCQGDISASISATTAVIAPSTFGASNDVGIITRQVLPNAGPPRNCVADAGSATQMPVAAAPSSMFRRLIIMI